MSTIDVVATARQLATAHPGAKLPCPICGASLGAANLERHLAKVHAGAAASATTTWRGKDRRVIVTSLIALAIAFVAVIVIINASGLSVMHNASRALLGGCLVIAVIPLLGALNKLPGSITLDRDAIVLRHSLGLGRRRVTLPCPLEAGALWRTRPDLIGTQAGVNAPGTPERFGSYLRFAGPRAITLGCSQAIQLTEHWAPATVRAGQRRRLFDLLLDRPSLVALEYALAARGVLALTGRDPAT
jgi:hypothetical protein